MSDIIIEGGYPIKGSHRVHGAKNAVLPILAATVLHSGKSVIHNCPNLSDVNSTIEILKTLGARVRELGGGTIEVDATQISGTEITKELMRESRSSIIFLGAIVARTKKGQVYFPGGCEIGARPIDLHIKALKELGVRIYERDGYITCDASSISPSEIHLNYPSVGATENIMLATALSPGTTTITNAAKEPEIRDLQLFLNKMGVDVRGVGTSEIKICGVSKLYDAQHVVMPDRIVAATFLCAAMVTGGEIHIENAPVKDSQAVVAALRDCGADIKTEDNSISLIAPKRIMPVNQIQTLPHPGFPTDAQALLTTVLSVAEGTSVIIENVFENRFRHCDELRRMGANISIEGRCAIIKGVKKLSATKVAATDLRGGAALLLAGLAAKGKTVLSGVEYIERGYFNLFQELNKLGAKITVSNH